MSGKLTEKFGMDLLDLKQIGRKQNCRNEQHAGPEVFGPNVHTF